MIDRVFSIAIAVNDARSTAETYKNLFGFEEEAELSFPDAGVEKSILLRVGKNTFLDIMEATEADSPLKRFLEKRGEGLFQLTMVADDVDKTAADLEKKGTRGIKWTIDPEKNVTVYYINPKSTSGVVFELITNDMLDKWGIKY